MMDCTAHDMDGREFVIWSNARPYDSDETYAKAIRNRSSKSGYVDVFLNKMYPLYLAKESFDMKSVVTFHMSCISKWGWGCCHGGDLVRDMTEKPQLQVISRGDSGIHRILAVDIPGERFLTEHLFTVDESGYDYPPGTKYGGSGGFTAYQFVLQFFKPRSITLCNFGLDDGWKTKFGEKHNLDFEQQYYKENNVCQIRI